ncbi:unnamed protein product [Auanema sp. JU1783]|nr:unnamed protein product [Auanema sp. JU1783]
MDLIKNSKYELLIAAYKSSLQKKHVLQDVEITSQQQGDDIFRAIFDAGTKQNVNIKMIENYAPKDRGDNIDGKILENHNAIKRKSLDFQKLLGRGKMHSKFIISDKKHAYIGSANLDWRSLNQKLEIGVLISDCGCLVKDLEGIFDNYWNLPSLTLASETRYNMENPLKININEEESEIYVAVRSL